MESVERLSRTELLMLHDQYQGEMRGSLDLAHRNLAFYVGLLSAILATVTAGLLNAEPGERRALIMLFGPGLVLVLAEVGYSTVAAFYHRFMDGYLTVVNIQRMLRLDDPDWISPGISSPEMPSRFGGFIARWVDPVDWLRNWPSGHDGGSVEAAKSAAMALQPVTWRSLVRGLRGDEKGFPTRTLVNARLTMWSFELAGLILISLILLIGLS